MQAGGGAHRKWAAAAAGWGASVRPFSCACALSKDIVAPVQRNVQATARGQECDAFARRGKAGRTWPCARKTPNPLLAYLACRWKQRRSRPRCRASALCWFSDWGLGWRDVE